jgi:non-ribosomal peptide synthase protein (TIGR01720 family)
MQVLHIMRSHAEPDLLLLVLHHLVVDGVSWRILLEDLQIIYTRLLHEQPLQLPPKTTSLKRWSEHLQAYADSPELAQEVAYWLAPEREDAPCLPLDFAAEPEANTEASVHSISLSLETAETRELLQDMPRVYHTQVNEVLLTALVLACAPWVGRPRLLVDLEGHGRETLFEGGDLSHTVGWFTSMFPVLLNLEHLAPFAASAIDLGQALKAIKEQLRSIPQHGISYGVLRYVRQDRALKAQLAALPQAQILFNYLGQFERVQQGPDEEGMFSPVLNESGPQRAPQNMRSHLLEVSSLVSAGRLQVEWLFSTSFHRLTTIETLAQGYLEMLRALIAHCRMPGSGGYTPSDFPDLQLSQARLDKIMGKLRSTNQRSGAHSSRPPRIK